MFMPYTPARNVNGTKIVETIVNVFMMSFMRFETSDM